MTKSFAMATKMQFSSVPAAAFLPKAVVTERVISVVKSIRSAPSAPREVDIKNHFVADLGFDSMIRKELTTKLGEEFCVTIPAKDSNSLLSVMDSVEYFAAHPKAR
jgi:acyl carrier protein